RQKVLSPLDVVGVVQRENALLPATTTYQSLPDGRVVRLGERERQHAHREVAEQGEGPDARTLGGAGQQLDAAAGRRAEAGQLAFILPAANRAARQNRGGGLGHGEELLKRNGTGPLTKRVPPARRFTPRYVGGESFPRFFSGKPFPDSFSERRSRK